ALVPLVIDSSIPWRMGIFVAISDIGLARVNSIAAACYQAMGRSGGNARLNVGFALARMLAALVWMVAAPHHDALAWSSFYLMASAIAAAWSLWCIRRDLGWPEWKIAWHEWRDGFQFALQTASWAAFGSTDKPVIALLSNLSTAGIYAAAS